MLKTMAKSRICQGNPLGFPGCGACACQVLKIVMGALNLFTIDS